MIHIIDFREQAKDGAVVPGQWVSGDPDVLRMAEQVTFLTHGFNVDRSEGKAKLRRLAEWLGLSSEVVLLLWPGDSALGPVNYPFEGRDADDTADYLVDFVTDHVAPDARLSFFAHSLGARVAMETIDQLKYLGYQFSQVCLVAAAIDDFSVSTPQLYRDAVDRSERVSVLASREDSVLKYAYPTGDLLQSFFFFWREHFGLALGYRGPRPSGEDDPVPTNVHHEQTPDSRKVDHGHYLPDGSGANTRAGRNQRSAARFAKAALTGAADPDFT